jgi:hypothetical protein
MPAGSASGLPAKDLVDVRLSDAFMSGGCPICAVRARSERAMLDTIIAERVLDIPFRESLERTQGFCRRHVAELVLADRRGPGGILGSSILYGAMLDRRLEPLRGALGRRGRSLRTRLAGARKRPPCLACDQGASAVETALGRLVARSGDSAWAEATSTAPFCLDDLVALWIVADGADAFEPIARRQVERVEALRSRLQGFVDHSAHDRRHLMADDEGTAAGEAAELLGGTRPDAGPRW